MVSLPSFHISWSSDQATPRDRRGLYGNKKYQKAKRPARFMLKETRFENSSLIVSKFIDPTTDDFEEVPGALHRQEDLVSHHFVPVTLNLFHSGRELMTNFILLCATLTLTMTAVQILYSLHSCLFNIELFHHLQSGVSVLGFGLLWGALCFIPCAFLPPARYIRIKLPVACSGILTFALGHYLNRPLLYIPLCLVFGFSLAIAIDSCFSYLLALIMYFIPFTDPQILPKFLIRYFCTSNAPQLLAGVILVLGIALLPPDDYNNGLSVTNISDTSHQIEVNQSVLPYMTNTEQIICSLLETQVGVIAFLLTIAAILFVSAFISIILQPMALEEHQDPLERSNFRVVLTNIVGLFSEKDPLFLFPLSITIGFQNAFVWTDVYWSYVTCHLSAAHFSYIVLSMGIFKLISSIFVIHVIWVMPRLAIAFAGLTFHAGIILTLGIWHPSSDDSVLFYVITGGIAICVSIWEVLILTRLSFVPTCQWRLIHNLTWSFRLLGSGLLLSLGVLLTTMDKLYILTALLLVSVGCLGYLETKKSY